MDANEAIGILRGDETAYYTPSMLAEAKRMGAEALEAWAWVERTGAKVARFADVWAVSYQATSAGRSMYQCSIGPTPLLAVLDAMEKEEG